MDCSAYPWRDQKILSLKDIKQGTEGLAGQRLGMSEFTEFRRLQQVSALEREKGSIPTIAHTAGQQLEYGGSSGKRGVEDASDDFDAPDNSDEKMPSFKMQEKRQLLKNNLSANQEHPLQCRAHSRSQSTFFNHSY